jgi:K+-transporting ATPase KdpF subunit
MRAVRGRVREAGMTADSTIGLLLVAALLVYLAVALLKPERF